MRDRVFYAIDENAARAAHEMMSFRNYKEGSLTSEYKEYVNRMYDWADRAAENRPDESEKIYGIADRYSKKMADNLNAKSRIGCMCPSVMISGAGNFPVRKKEKQNAASDRNWKEFQGIQKMADKIQSIVNGKDIVKSGDADAVERLEHKLDRLKKLQETMNAVNAYYRKNRTVDGCPGLSVTQTEAIKADMREKYCKDRPFMSYELANNNAEIRRVEKRLESLKAAKETGNKEHENDYFRVVENTEIMRLQIFFDGKPDLKIRDVLKGNGFRWSPKNGCWQRQLTNNARYALKEVVSELEKFHRMDN